MDKRTRAKFTTLAKRVNEASGTAADVATAKTDIENLKSSKANIEDLTAAAGRIDVLEAESASVKQLVAGKASVADLTAATGRIDDLEADTASLEQAVVEKASIADLDATNAEVSNLKTDKANITDLNAANAEIDTLKTSKASVADLTAATGRIDDLEAENASVKELVASKADVKDLTAATGRIDSLETDVANANKLIAEKADVTDLNAATAEIDTLKTGKASVADLNTATAEIDALKTNKANVTDLNAATGRIDDLEADTASLGQAVVEKASITDLNATNAEVGNLKTDKADVDLLNVVKATIESLLVRGGIITDSLTGVEINATKFLTGVTIIGDVIKAGTLAADRIILTGENGLIYELNVNAGNLTASQLTEEQYKQALDGSVLVASSITTDKLAAGSVTAQVIASGAVTTDKLEVGAVKAKHIDVDDLFAQNITATGAITGAKLNGAELDCGRTEGSKNYTCTMKNGKMEAAYQDNLLDGGDKERYAVTVNKDAATALEIEHIYDSATNGVSKQRTIVDADSIRVGDKSTGNNYNSPLDTKGMYVKRDGLYAWDYLNLKVGDILNEYVSLLRYASCDTQDADKEKLILGDKNAGVRVWGNEGFATLTDASAILANTKWVTDKLAAVLADYALASAIPTKLPANGGHADSADNASKLSGLAVGKRWGNIPQIGTDGVMEVGKYLDFHDGDNADSTDYDARITCNGDIILIPKLSVDKITDNSYSTNTYTSFSGSVVSSGSVVVTKKLGVCYIIGTLALSGKVSSWTTILGSSAIPAPQHGVLVPFEMSQWKASYAQALRGKITPDGELQLVYGAAGNYVINISYPID